MRRIRVLAPSPALIVASVALFAALGGTSYAVISGGVPDKQGVFHACVNRGTGAIRIVTKTNQCAKPHGHGKHRALGELAVAWSQTGPRGLPGTNATVNGVPAGGALTGTYPNPTLASGAVTPAAMGTIPAAVVTNTLDEPTTSGNHTVMTFDTAQVNDDGVYSPAHTDRLTAPISGLYAVHGEIAWAISGGSGLYEVEIYVNNFASRVGVTALQPVPGGNSEGVNALVHLNAGDYVTLTARQLSGSTVSVNGTTTEHAPDSPEFDMHWVGP